ncbi:hypothetical protein [Anaerolinea thermophila]|uniref:hypothetical protein n=1 Tax=Anaerolinea thermophila TaxID=167964 RepID=UPI0003174C55|nr:hypothetical protein [Anaerolinea thermophila]
MFLEEKVHQIPALKISSHLPLRLDDWATGNIWNPELPGSGISSRFLLLPDTVYRSCAFTSLPQLLAEVFQLP